MKFNWRKWIRIIHRDFGYLFFGATIVYGLSGIALNHLDEWNPNYIIENRAVQVKFPENVYELSRDDVRNIMAQIGEERNFKNFYFPDDQSMKVFIRGGSVLFDLETGQGLLESIRRRPVFHEVNFLHYNPVRLWTWFSDLFAGALIVLAMTGLFMVKGKKGITGRGAWLTAVGILIPLAFLLIYL
ncbi:MAG TPA: hypothetical protein ENF21_09100 [Bacteroidetes bacterium]|nr:hypothetical protein [Bacteroidota bacterium]